eukprot:1970149-Rhodomonas_salina.2
MGPIRLPGKYTGMKLLPGNSHDLLNKDYAATGIPGVQGALSGHPACGIGTLPDFVCCPLDRGSTVTGVGQYCPPHRGSTNDRVCPKAKFVRLPGVDLFPFPPCNRQHKGESRRRRTQCNVRSRPGGVFSTAVL